MADANQPASRPGASPTRPTIPRPPGSTIPRPPGSTIPRPPGAAPARAGTTTLPARPAAAAPARPVAPVRAVPADSYFDGSTLGLIGYNLLTGFVCFLTLGIAYPWMHCVMQGWVMGHTVLRGRRLKFDGRGSQLIGNYLIWLLLTFVTFGIYGFWLGVEVRKWTVKHIQYADGQNVPSHFSGGAGGYFGTRLLAFLLTVFTLGIGGAWGDVMILRWEVEHTHIGGDSLKFAGTGGQLFVMRLITGLLTLPTLGIYTLFYPVKYLKWQVGHTDLTVVPGVIPGTLAAVPGAVAAAPRAPSSGAGKVLVPVCIAAAAVWVLTLGTFLGRDFVQSRVNAFMPTSNPPVSEPSESESPAPEQSDPPETAPAPENTEPAGLVFPDSDTQTIDQGALESLTDSELTYAINELYARHGYIFRSEALLAHYSQFDWYAPEVPSEEFSTDCFNATEQENWNLLIGERSRRRAAE